MLLLCKSYANEVSKYNIHVLLVTCLSKCTFCMKFHFTTLFFYALIIIFLYIRKALIDESKCFSMFIDVFYDLLCIETINIIFSIDIKTLL